MRDRIEQNYVVIPAMRYEKEVEHRTSSTDAGTKIQVRVFVNSMITQKTIDLIIDKFVMKIFFVCFPPNIHPRMANIRVEWNLDEEQRNRFKSDLNRWGAG